MSNHWSLCLNDAAVQDLGLLAYNQFHFGKYLSRYPEEREKTDTYELEEGSDQTIKIKLDGSEAGRNNPDVQEWQTSKQQAPDQWQREAQNESKESIDPAPCLCEGVVADFPHEIQTV